MSELAIVLWIVAGALFVGALVLVVGAAWSVWRKMNRLADEMGGLSEDAATIRESHLQGGPRR